MTSIRGSRTVCTLLCAAMLIVSVHGTADAGWTPMSTGTAGASHAFSFGMESAFSNPAHLGFVQETPTQLRILGLGAGLTSNGLGWDDYRKYNGATLSTNDKLDILNTIPADGMHISADASATALAFRHGHLSLHADGLGTGGGRLDRDAIALLLFGNADKPEWAFEDADAEALASWNIRLGYGRSLTTISGHRLMAGISVSYVRGLYYTRAVDASADLLTATTGLSGSAAGDVYTSEGGGGYGVDAGLALELGRSFVVSIHAENVAHRVHWSKNSEVTHYNLFFDDLTVENFEDSLWIAEEHNESIDAFNRSLPTQLTAGLGHAGRTWRYGATVRIAAENSLSYSTTPVIAVGVEHDVLHFLPLRAGASIGGNGGPAFGWGGGARMGYVDLNVGVRIDRGVWVGTGRGLTAAMALDISL